VRERVRVTIAATMSDLMPFFQVERLDKSMAAPPSEVEGGRSRDGAYWNVTPQMGFA
jgi:hypothetical protein